MLKQNQECHVLQIVVNPDKDKDGACGRQGQEKSDMHKTKTM